jgi:hypothetical protein
VTDKDSSVFLAIDLPGLAKVDYSARATCDSCASAADPASCPPLSSAATPVSANFYLRLDAKSFYEFPSADLAFSQLRFPW